MLRVRSSRAEARANEILGRLPHHFELKDGLLSHKTEQSDAVRAVLANQFFYNEELQETEFRDCVRAATKILFERDDFSVATFHSVLEKQIRVLLRKTQSKYTMWSKINFNPSVRKTKTLGSWTVTIAPSLPARMASGFTDPNRRNSTVQQIPASGGFIYCSGMFRSDVAAGFSISDAIERFVSVLNFRQNVNTSFVWPESSRAVFRTGPSFLLYDEAKQEYFENYWTNPEFGALLWRVPSDGQDRIAIALRYCDLVRRMLSRNPLSETALRCMQLLNNGWETTDEQRWVMLVWACFEKLFSDRNSGSQTKTETIIARAAKLDSDPVLRTALLYTLNEHRNDAAHANQSRRLGAPLASECTNYLLWLIHWSIENGRKFKSEDEFIRFVDLPKEPALLRERQKLNRLALSFWMRPK